MSKEFAIDHEKARLVVCKSGPGSVEDAEATLRRMAELCRRHGLTSILLDLSRRRVKMDDLGLYRIGAMYESFAGGGQRIALIGSLDTGSSGYFESVARDRGANVRVFASREEAEAWLDGEADPPAED